MTAAAVSGATVLLLGIALPAASQRPASLRLVEDLRIGREDDGRYALSRIRHIAVSEGAVYIAQPQESRIRVFDAAGTFVRYIGRAGDGPGEFRSLGWIGLRSDTLWASDRHRIHAFTPDGDWIATHPLNIEAGGAVLSVQQIHAALHDGAFGAVPQFVPRSDVERYEDPPVLRVTRDGEATVLGHVDLSALASYRHDGLLRAAPVPFGVYGLVGWDPNGRFAILVRQSIPVTREAAFTLTMVTPRADTVWSRTLHVPADPVPVPARDSVAAARRRAFSLGGISPDHARTIEAAAPVPDHYPPVHSIHIGSDGRIWLGVGAPDARRWQS